MADTRATFKQFLQNNVVPFLIRQVCSIHGLIQGFYDNIKGMDK